MIHKIIDCFGNYFCPGDIERRRREWRCQQIELEMEEIRQEIAALGATLGAIQREKQQIENDHK